MGGEVNENIEAVFLKQWKVQYRCVMLIQSATSFTKGFNYFPSGSQLQCFGIYGTMCADIWG